MDVRVYFQRVRQAEAGIADEFVFVTSLETPDGGKAGTVTEVARSRAARLMVEHRARLAAPEEIALHKQHEKEVRRQAESESRAGRVQVNLITESDLRALKSVREK